MRASELEATLSVIRGQADTTPEAKLMMSVFEASVMDAAGFSSQSDMHPSDRDLARRYLRGPMPHLDLAGVNPDWARYKLQQRGMWNELVGDGNA